MRKKIKIILVLLLVLSICISAFSQIFHTNKGESVSVGDYNDGALINGYLLPRKGENFVCHSWISYYILGREYIHSKVYKAVIASYAELAVQYLNTKFVYMEASHKKGGRMYPHRTHQNGLSLDFMSPLITQNGKPKYYTYLGIFRYTLDFNEDGTSELNSDVQIDFNLMAKHILVLEKHARTQGLRIKKVILKIDLKDNLFATENGKKLKKSGIYFAQTLTPLLNKLHDDHYHIDFELIK